MRRYRFPVDVFALVVGAAVVLMGLEGLVAMADLSPLDVADAHRILSSLSRAHNQLMAVMFISIAVAVPVTASQYTPKLLRIFLGDRTHVAVLSTFALAAAHANWVMYLSRREAVSSLLVTGVLATCVIAFILVVPYFFYVIELLEPRALVARIQAQAERALIRAGGPERRLERAKNDLSHALHDLGSLVLKSLDGMGRESAAIGIAAIRELLADYGAKKPTLVPGWFEATKAEFRGLSREALQFTTVERCWVEVAALRDLGRVFDRALHGMPDAVVLIADTVRGIGEDAHDRDDIPVLANTVRAMNSMLRSAINAKNPRAIFDVLLQYEALAEVCLDRRPEIAGEIAGHYAHYAIRARRADMEFIPELFVYDLGALMRTAVEQQSSACDAILQEILAVEDKLATHPTVPLACAIAVILGSTRTALPQDSQSLLLDRLNRLPPKVRGEAMKVLDRTTSPRYHELSSRQVDVNFLPPQDLEWVQEQLDDAE